MIHVICKSEAYTYNVYHIIKAFFPSEKITSETEEEASHYVVVRLPDGGRMMIGEGQLKEAAGLRKGEDSEQIKAQRKYWIDVCLYEELKKLTYKPLPGESSPVSGRPRLPWKNWRRDGRGTGLWPGFRRSAG